MAETTVPLGEILIQRGLIDRKQLDMVLAEQQKTHEPLGQILLRNHFVRDEKILKEIIAEQTSSSLLTSAQLKPKNNQRLKEIIPREMALQHLILPLSREGNELKIAIAKTPDVILMDTLRKVTGCDILSLLATEADVKLAIEKFYSSQELEEVVSSTAIDNASSLYVQEVQDQETDLSKLVADGDQAPVVRLVDLLLKRAVDDRASDIHIEPFKDTISLRYRVDGTLYELQAPPKQFHIAIISRIKILTKLDIAEKRIPQDGSFSINYQNRRIDIRVSTVPVVHGEKVVMRLLDKKADLLDINMLGLEPQQLKTFEECINRPYGLIFVTGPTGSGKSTTLYAALNKRRSPKINIVTLEDPVEFQLAGVNQVQVKPEIGLTFATGLRAFLRQDPDVMLVGEVRDQETAEICIRAALTGHLVLSTLHTNDSATAVSRLVDIGIKPFLVSASLLMIVAQRLVRKLCDKCKEPRAVDDKLRELYKFKVDTIYEAKGCKECRNIGYWGRRAVYELLPINEELRRMIAQDAKLDEIRRIQKSMGLGTLLTSALHKVEEGVTTLEEALSVGYE